MTDRASIFFVTLLVVGWVGGTASLASGASATLQLDEQTPLTEESNIQAFEDGDAVTVHTQQVMMALTVAHDPEGAGVTSPLEIDSGNTYLRVQYNESLERTLRFYVPREYWGPYPKEELEAIDSDATVSLSPTVDGNYTAVTIHVTGRTDAVFPVSLSAAGYFEARRYTHDVVENQTGWSIPSLSASKQWSRLNERALTGSNTTASITHGDQDLIVQYNAGTASEPRWLNARPCDSRDAPPVCTITRTNATDTTLVMSTQANPPPVRYKVGGSFLDELTGGWRELTGLGSGLSDYLKDILP